MATLEFVVLGLVGIGAGALAFRWGLKRREPYELVTATPTTAVRDLTDPGIVELKGRIEPAEELDEPTFRSPIGRRDDAVLAAWRVEEWRQSGKHSSWETVASGVRSRPFAVNDGTGSVVVAVGDHADSAGFWTGATDPKASDGVSFGDVLCEFDRFPVAAEVEADRPAPKHVRRFVDATPGVDRQSGSGLNLLDIGNQHGDRRYHERTLHPGDDVYVLGRAYPRSDDTPRPLRPERMVISPPRGDDDGMLIVSNERERDLVRQTGYHLLGIVGGALLVLAGVFLIAVPV